VKPSEISEVITHLAFYSGWPTSMSVIPSPKMCFLRAELEPISFRRRQVRSFPSIKRRKRRALRSRVGEKGRLLTFLRGICDLSSQPMRCCHLVGCGLRCNIRRRLCIGKNASGPGHRHAKAVLVRALHIAVD
jgi:4-carboxymuconolactone decarboxylase